MLVGTSDRIVLPADDLSVALAIAAPALPQPKVSIAIPCRDVSQVCPRNLVATFVADAVPDGLTSLQLLLRRFVELQVGVDLEAGLTTSGILPRSTPRASSCLPPLKSLSSFPTPQALTNCPQSFALILCSDKQS